MTSPVTGVGIARASPTLRWARHSARHVFARSRRRQTWSPRCGAGSSGLALPVIALRVGYAWDDVERGAWLPPKWRDVSARTRRHGRASARGGPRHRPPRLPPLPMDGRLRLLWVRHATLSGYAVATTSSRRPTARCARWRVTGLSTRRYRVRGGRRVGECPRRECRRDGRRNHRRRRRRRRRPRRPAVAVMRRQLPPPRLAMATAPAGCPRPRPRHGAPSTIRGRRRPRGATTAPARV